MKLNDSIQNVIICINNYYRVLLKNLFLKAELLFIKPPKSTVAELGGFQYAKYYVAFIVLPSFSFPLFVHQ